MNDITDLVNELAVTREAGGELFALVDELLKIVEPGNHRILVARWNCKHGLCEDCGIPAAFLDLDAYGLGKHRMLCAVCAANAAAEGQSIHRIEPPSDWAIED